MSPITTLLSAACAAVVAIDASSSHGIARITIDLFIGGVSLFFGLKVAQIRKPRCPFQFAFRLRRLWRNAAQPAQHELLLMSRRFLTSPRTLAGRGRIAPGDPGEGRGNALPKTTSLSGRVNPSHAEE